MKIYKIAAVALLITFASITWSFKEDLFQVSKNLDIFASLYKEININYVEETNPSSLMRSSIDAMLENLDPYTEYVPESEVEDYKLKYVSTQYGGIGASTIFIEGKLFVNEVNEGYPADKQGVKPGDQLVKINGNEVKGKDRAQVSQLLRGPKGSVVELLIIREGTLITKNLTRDEIKQPNVAYSGMTADNIAYIRLDKFLENSAQEVKDAAVTLGRQQPKGMILDLRYNGGGILQEAVKIVNIFVDKDILIVTQKGRNPQKTITYKTINQPLFPNVPLVVLISGSSASASEIVAGALQDLDRAIIVGQRSYGKGLVQQTFNLPYNSLVKVTVAKYFTPSGRCIQALDYAHKDANGKTLKFADSLMSKFSTKTGRNVYDGNGIYPDVLVNSPKLSPVTISLLNKNLFFDYANNYKKNNKEIAPAASFQLTENDYAAFVNTMAGRDYSYTSRTERLLSDLRTEAEKENKLTLVKADLEDLKEKMLGARKTDLTTYKAEIKRVLETQIVSRYYYEKGKVIQAFQYDKELNAAKSLLNNNNKMLAILKGEGEYKTIGSPIKTIAAASDNN
ncbi:S41 family peptidase [Pedobacter heparinus]|uniref:Carboxyl-terminal protease n=1 Tax=Pedobacter heparinus (strain ATCC 13125 / DSM 2366 / CIP 104194 / JCM 7457 / NBRC 12017 / NCIMB 9290 / NRRL B-14731 / HIM 762-3) TaxID=485917 RepID=C6XWM3_PEDHD|nr:S41 family peptidase [Pedobacter heparinus]ACU06312.1 carboxyl-terminal protease [Pedobacter heparinus DSM 2366]